MNRTEFDKKIRQKICNLIDNAYLPKDVQLEYFRRLIKPYIKNKVNDYFITQYLQADGNELSKKFWSIHSSSRFAFELYSWMAEDERIQDFCFEKKLEGLNGAEKKPNMDVYIQTKDRIYFIESKFTELTSQKIAGLSEAYYCRSDEAKNRRGLVVKKELEERYYDDRNAYDAFPGFIKEIINLLEGNKEKPCWMDFKQEITHLVGIYLTVSRNSFYRDKNVRFLNVYYDFEDGTNDLIGLFFDKANTLMKDLLKDYCKSFEYKHISAQDLVNSNEIVEFDLEKHAYGLNDKTVGEMMKYYFEF